MNTATVPGSLDRVAHRCDRWWNDPIVLAGTTVAEPVVPVGVPAAVPEVDCPPEPVADVPVAAGEAGETVAGAPVAPPVAAGPVL